MDFIAYSLLTARLVFRLKVKKISTNAIIRTAVLGFFMLFGTFDLIMQLAKGEAKTSSTVSAFNFLIIVIYVRANRKIMTQFGIVLYYTIPILVIMLTYFLIFFLLGFILFANKDRNGSFVTYSEAMYTLYILFTVSNYPDVQIPYIEKNRLSMLYFQAFLLIGLILLSNLLLAQIFMNYEKVVIR